jgi:hypothetical protein
VGPGWWAQPLEFPVAVQRAEAASLLVALSLVALSLVALSLVALSLVALVGL